jgi:hypothetical protein
LLPAEQAYTYYYVGASKLQKIKLK